MKNPCEECLVGMCCTEICSEKRNYDTLIKDALKCYQSTRGTRYNNNLYHPAIFRYNDHFRTYFSKQRDSDKTNTKILIRKKKFKEGDNE